MAHFGIVKELEVADIFLGLHVIGCQETLFTEVGFVGREFFGGGKLSFFAKKLASAVCT